MYRIDFSDGSVVTGPATQEQAIGLVERRYPGCYSLGWEDDPRDGTGDLVEVVGFWPSRDGAASEPVALGLAVVRPDPKLENEPGVLRPQVTTNAYEAIMARFREDVRSYGEEDEPEQED